MNAELQKLRDEAGARYAAAAAVFRSAYIALAALDAALENGHVDTGPEPIRTFFPTLQSAAMLRHPVYFQTPDDTCWFEQINAARDVILRTIANV